MEHMGIYVRVCGPVCNCESSTALRILSDTLSSFIVWTHMFYHGVLCMYGALKRVKRKTCAYTCAFAWWRVCHCRCLHLSLHVPGPRLGQWPNKNHKHNLTMTAHNSGQKTIPNSEFGWPILGGPFPTLAFIRARVKTYISVSWFSHPPSCGFPLLETNVEGFYAERWRAIEGYPFRGLLPTPHRATQLYHPFPAQ